MSALISPPLDKTDFDGLPANGDLLSDTATPNWAELRRLSLLPGGFGQRRVELWTQALGVSLPAQDTQFEEPQKAEDLEPHKDERQIRLDTDRSFVLYPVEDDMKKREALKDQLYDLLVALFRKRRRLHYFQGYHDIVSVLFLTLPQELQFPCVEKLSLHRHYPIFRHHPSPLILLPRVLKRVIDVADPEFAALVDHTPLPYYALSNLLTLFSHDVPTLALIQHVFDYLLSRPPIAAVYLAAAIVLTRKEEVKRLTEEDEEGMIHSLLSSLPDFYEEVDEESISDSLLLEPEKIDEYPETKELNPRTNQASTLTNP
ncbi:hypothetical protein NLI96_g12913 [Meripilus lineatus]|uniref:Rab-GAP TBC domain-containing protein n=1 Tax=Meripilus lineatus TaxID=2056292 RepID=A0AAD5UP16_9APHY|nr:hypothetical protein NLI96_g12913 [Physisporinus lineatus]